MAKCPCVEEGVRVQTVGTGGIGVYPPVEVETIDKISDTGREMKKTGAGDTCGCGTGSGSGSGSSGSGGSGDVLVVHVAPDGSTLNKTYNEIKAAALAGKLVYEVGLHIGLSMENDGEDQIYYIASYLCRLSFSNGQYCAKFDGVSGYYSDSPDGVLSLGQGGGGTV